MSEIRENQKTKLIFRVADGSEEELECSIKKVYKDRISLDFPKEIIYYVDYLQEGDEVTAKIFTPAGIKMFDAIILDAPSDNDFVIEFVEDYMEIQRRKYLRTEFNTKLMIERGKDSIITHTLDIGGGGIRFFYEGSLEPMETIICRLFIPALPSIQVQGIILKGDNLKENEYVLVFTKIQENDRDKIIKKCFEIQVNSYK